MTILTSQDKEKVKRAIPKASNKIIDATVARLYVAYPDPGRWNYTGLCGAIAIVDDLVGHSFFLKLIDISGSRGVLWDQELCCDFQYNQDRLFFHTFELDTCLAGLLFESKKDAQRFFRRVTHTSKYGSRDTLKNRKAIQLKRKAPPQAQAGERAGISAGAMGVSTPAPVYYDGEPPLEWRSLYQQLESVGISSDMIADNRQFIKDYIAQHGGPLVGLEPPIPRPHSHAQRMRSNSRREKKAPPPPPPPASTAAAEQPSRGSSPESESAGTPTNVTASQTSPQKNFVPPLPTYTQARPSPAPQTPQRPLPALPTRVSARPPPPPPRGSFTGQHGSVQPGQSSQSLPQRSRIPPPPPPRRRAAPPPPPRRSEPASAFTPPPTQQVQMPTLPQRTPAAPAQPARQTYTQPPAPSVPAMSPPATTFPEESTLPPAAPVLPPPAPAMPPAQIPQAPPAPPPPSVSSAPSAPPAPPAPPAPTFSSAPSAPPAPPAPAGQSSTPALPTPDAGRSALLESIRNSGIQSLKKTDKSHLDRPSVLLQPAGSQRASAAPAGQGQPGNLADALAAALQKRKDKVAQSDDEDDDW